MSTKDRKSDVEFIAALAEMLRDNDLSELEVHRDYGEDDALTVRVARQAAVVAAPAPAAVHVAPPPAAPAAAAPAPVAAPASDDPADNPSAIKSPMVGTSYLAPEPGAAPFISVGDTVKEGQTLMIIEAMKTMNQIPSPRAGKVTRILVEDGSPIEFGSPLLILE